MPVSLRNRTKDTTTKKQTLTNLKAAVIPDNKGQGNNINKHNGSEDTKCEESKGQRAKSIQTRGKQRQIIDMFPKKINNRATTVDTTAAGSTL